MAGDGLLRRFVELRAASRSDDPFVPECLLQPDDEESAFWVERALPDLMAWRRDRDRFVGPNHHVRLDTDLDFLDGLFHQYRMSGEPRLSLKSAGRVYNFLARFATAPRRGICIVATARNEGVYLLEWLAYHKSIGVEAFFLYSNNNDDGSDELLRRLSKAGAINWLENIVGEETSPQFKAYNHALNVLPQVLDFRWAIFIDLDEFLVVDPDRFTGLDDYVTWQEQQPVDAIGFNWANIGSSGLNKWSPEFLRNRFTQRVGGPDKHIKSMLRPQRFLYCRVHYPVADWRIPVVMRDSSGYPDLNYYGGVGDERAFSLHPKAEAAWVNHYCTKSAEEFVWRRWRNVGSEKISKSLLTPNWLRAFAAQHWLTDLVHDDRILRCGHGFQECYDALISIAGVPTILEEVHDTFCVKLKSIKNQLLNDPSFINSSDELVQSFLNCLRT
jgi:hypothetical protein